MRSFATAPFRQWSERAHTRSFERISRAFVIVGLDQSEGGPQAAGTGRGATSSPAHKRIESQGSIASPSGPGEAHRNGEPRQEIDPWAQVNDYRHAISYARTREEVDGERIGIWGSSYSGAHVLVVGAIDRRVKC